MPERNPDLVAVQVALTTVFERLSAALAAEPDFARKLAINRELAEVNHRITMLGGLIFAARSARLAPLAAAVDAAGPEIDAAIARIERIADFIGAVSKFLGVVDALIDAAKSA